MEFLDMLRLEKESGKKERASERYTRIDIDLSDPAYANKSMVDLGIYGDYLAKAKYTGNDGTATIRLNHRHAKPIYMSEFFRTKGGKLFEKVYLTTTDTSGHLVFYVGFNDEIEPSSGREVKVLNLSGVEIDPVQDKRYKKHTFGHVKPTTMTAANTAQALTASKNVKWAIIHFLSKVALIGGSTLTRDGGAADGQKYTEGAYLTVEYADLAEIYIINFTVDESCIYSITYVEEA